ncbi:MAG: 1,4-alpha-glucan branching protein GlgB [Pirellulaceae bacterium]
MRTQVTLEGMGALVEGVHEDPFQLLGPHPVEQDGRKALAVRAYLPEKKRVWVLDPAQQASHPMRRIHPAGVFEAICPLPEHPSQRYMFRVADNDGEITTMHDPYAFDSLLTDYDFYLFGAGCHEQIFEKMGAHPRTVDGVPGTNFAVWAPNATSVSVVGGFNGWDGRRHLMRKHIPSGIWELFVPGVGAGQDYKFRIRSWDGQTSDRADPYGFSAELPPCTASVVADLDRYEWQDQKWMDWRRDHDPLNQPLSIYEVHLGSWRRADDRKHGWLNYRELAHELVDYCHQMGYTHLELMPVSEHPLTASWGYQTVGYFSVTSRYGTPEDFMYFVDHCHRNGIGIILDWVPAHFPKDGHGLRRFDGTALYEHEDPRQGEHPDWGTMVFNYGRSEVHNFLVANALFWLDKYHIDGLRVDAVASMLYLDYSREEGQWVPNEYGGRENLAAIDLLKKFNELSHRNFPGVLTIAEESTAWGGVSRPTYTGGLGFSLKWNMGWMNDTLRYMRIDPIYRKYHHNDLTFSLIYAFTENFALPLSHDEVVHGKSSLLGQMAGDLWQKFANLRLLYTYMWSHPGKKLLFMGSDVAQWKEWSHETEVQWDLLQWDTHKGVQSLVADLNGMYRREPALYEQDFVDSGFEWIDCHSSSDSVLCFMRKAFDPKDFLVICCNFTPVVRTNYRVGVPTTDWYQEIFNSDSRFYDGTNVGNYPGLQAEPIGHHGQPCSILPQLPPLAALVFKPQAASSTAVG